MTNATLKLNNTLSIINTIDNMDTTFDVKTELYSECESLVSLAYYIEFGEMAVDYYHETVVSHVLEKMEDAHIEKMYEEFITSQPYWLV